MIENSNPSHVNRLRGILGVASGWDTDPTNLANCTDGDLSTVTGTGSTNKLAAGDYGYLVFDMGATYTVMVNARVGLWCASLRQLYTFVAGSDDGITWRDINNSGGGGANTAYIYSAPATEVVVEHRPAIITGRYIRLRFYVSGASNTANAKIYEIYAYDMGNI